MNKLKVLHSYPYWLPLTQTWMFNQVDSLYGKTIECHVVCEKTQNLDYFYVPNIHSLENASRLRYYWDKLLLNLRIRRHLGFLNHIAKKIDAHILHSHFGNIGWSNIRAAEKLKLKHLRNFVG